VRSVAIPPPRLSVAGRRTVSKCLPRTDLWHTTTGNRNIVDTIIVEPIRAGDDRV
jgi:hypothetical protein